jgi:DNA-binding MarR family transcriptional regulator
MTNIIDTQQSLTENKLDTGNLDKHARRLADLVFALLASCHEKEARMAARHGLTSSEFRCLRYLNTLDRPTNKQLAEQMALSPGRLTRILDGLAGKEFVVRSARAGDRRTVEVHLTSKGFGLLHSLNEDNKEAHKEILMAMEIPHEELICGMEVFLESVKKWLEKT